jgi:hypothetical protein
VLRSAPLACRRICFRHCRPRSSRITGKRTSAEDPYELRRHPPLQATLLAAYCHLRGYEITDNLVDLLIDTGELIEDLKRVAGKNNLLFQLAEATLTHPDGIGREVVFPVVDEQTLCDLVKEWKATGPVYRQQLRSVIRNSYRSHFRQMLPIRARAPRNRLRLRSPWIAFNWQHLVDY